MSIEYVLKGDADPDGMLTFRKLEMAMTPEEQECEEKILELEKEAILRNRSAILALVGMFRVYRKACRRLTHLKYADGACDGATMFHFEETLLEAQYDHLSRD